MNLNDIPHPVIVQLPQGSPEWLAYRRAKRNASESAAVMGASPWMTPYQLWLAKTGRQETTVTPAMQRGTDLEPLARSAYEEQTGLVMQPLVLEAGEYSASLDGMTLEGDLVLEIKCPVRGCDSDLWQQTVAGQAPMHYRIQVQHQLMVSGSQTAHLWVFDGAKGVLVTIERDEALMEAIRSAWDRFQPHLDTDTPPVLSEADTRVRTDQAWQEAAQRYAELKHQADALAEQLEQARKSLLSLAQHPRESGGGVTVTRYWRQGNVDYKKIPTLRGVDLTAWRTSPREEVRVSVD